MKGATQWDASDLPSADLLAYAALASYSVCESFRCETFREQIGLPVKL